MQFISKQHEATANDIKAKLYQLMHEHDVTQEELAFELGIERSIISRFTNPASEQHPDLFILASCAKSTNDKVHQLGLAMLDDIEDMAGRDGMPRKRIPTDGSLQDELQDLAIAQGKFGQALKENKIEPAEKIARTVQEIASRMMAEVADYRKRVARG